MKKLGYEVAIINNNPETVSTDFDTADRLYFEPLTPEDVMGVINTEKPIGVVVAFGGQTAIKLTKFLDNQGLQLLLNRRVKQTSKTIDLLLIFKAFNLLMIFS